MLHIIIYVVHSLGHELSANGEFSWLLVSGLSQLSQPCSCLGEFEIPQEFFIKQVLKERERDIYIYIITYIEPVVRVSPFHPQTKMNSIYIYIHKHIFINKINIPQTLTFWVVRIMQ